MNVFLPIIREWSARTETGDRAELEDLPEDLPFWNEVSATAETCLGTECPRYDDCFVTRMRQRAAASDVVIVNHHLLCADAAVRQNALRRGHPGLRHAIIDEAHQLEDVATQYFGFQRQQLPPGRAGARRRAPGGDRRRRRTNASDRQGGRRPARSRPRVLRRARLRASRARIAFAARNGCARRSSSLLQAARRGRRS